ncbi:E3 ubiquitin-protein ligase hel2 [Magnolia sinica]|uniref:E3 ubiquitin-protein ligase hel2 n=1 Tax=Magnolia sinica TaxID=86752 RepID=UPI00265AC515|nr:E3 ubiquitin-protein ligase hel2 [Magnolia sinica]
MDDSCAVCAEPLEWVGYGSCGHREVCSTCVARLRFVLNDHRCCICKMESQSVFVTKALGDYTRTISDFSVFPSDATEGRVGEYWYHEDTQAYFDDVDHYRMIKAMCRLSCSICDKYGEEQGSDGVKRRSKFRNIEQLKGHLYHRHRLVMCNLCLEGRKVFICEQKLYTRAQLNQHINTGDSEVDGSENERGGFSGHPICEFCRSPFYGDNELYLHMSTEHYTCHICQRQHPGQYEYYKNYDDLEIHFRNEHFLCENEACLVKKFVVFQSESEMKRHNTIEHGGHMSRSKRNAALQIPTSFRYRRNSVQDQRRGRGRGSRPDSSDDQFSLAIQASIETANADNLNHVPSSLQLVDDHGEVSEIGAALDPFESLVITPDSEPSSRYLQAAAAQSLNAPLEASSFPPLSGAPSSSQQMPKHDSEGPQGSTMAARLRRKQGGVRVLNKDGERVLNFGRGRPRTGVFLPSSSATPSWPAINHGPISSSSSSSSQARPATIHGHAEPSSASCPWNSSSIGRVSHSVSAPNLVDRGSSSSSMSGKVASSGSSHNQVQPAIGQHLLNVEDVQTANKSLVERIRAALEMDENKYTAFKEISSEYRQGVIGTPEYLAYVQQFGLSHLVLELAKLCPDPRKQRELVETYNASLRSDGPQENGIGNSSGTKGGKGSRKGKDKFMDGAEINAKDILADSVINTVRKLQASYKPSEEVEVLLKDGYRAAKGKPMVSSMEERAEPTSASLGAADLSSNNESQSNGGGSNQNLGGGGNTKQRRKTSKFHRVRLGDGSAAALFGIGRSGVSPEREEETAENVDPSEGLPVRGVWKNGGGQKLVARTQKGPAK